MNPKKYSFFLCFFLFSILTLSILNIYHCPIKYIFGLSCPVCGMTRAIVCVLQLKFFKSFYYHLFWPVAIIAFVVYLLYIFKKIKINKKNIEYTFYILCFFNTIYYFYRLFYGSNIVYFDFSKSLLYKIINMF